MRPPRTVNPQLEGKYDGLFAFLDSGIIHPNHCDYGKEYFVNEWEDDDGHENIN